MLEQTLQEILRNWKKLARFKSLHFEKKGSRVNKTTFQLHLDYFYWHYDEKNLDNLFLAFLADVPSVHQ